MDMTGFRANVLGLPEAAPQAQYTPYPRGASMPDVVYPQRPPSLYGAPSGPGPTPPTIGGSFRAMEYASGNPGVSSAAVDGANAELELRRRVAMANAELNSRANVAAAQAELDAHAAQPLPLAQPRRPGQAGRSAPQGRSVASFTSVVPDGGGVGNDVRARAAEFLRAQGLLP